MHIERRNSVRREVHLSAKIDIGGGRPLTDCTVVDIADYGARIAIAAPEEAPKEFILYLSPCGFPFRRCRLVWRTKDHIGVEFDSQFRRRNQLPNPEKSELAPAPASGASQ
jgi:hypothetical protein